MNWLDYLAIFLGADAFEKGSPALQATNYLNRRIAIYRLIAALTGLSLAYLAHRVGLAYGVNPELKDSGVQYGELILRGYGFPGAFIVASVILGTCGFGRTRPLEDSKDSDDKSANGGSQCNGKPQALSSHVAM